LLATINPGDGSSLGGQVQSSENYYFSNMAYSLLYALIGFVVVFIGIALLILIIWLIGYVFKNIESKKSEKVEPAVTIEEVSGSTVSESEASDEIPDEIKAVIMAAIIGYYDKKEEKCEFTVRRIKRL